MCSKRKTGAGSIVLEVMMSACITDTVYHRVAQGFTTSANHHFRLVSKQFSLTHRKVSMSEDNSCTVSLHGIGKSSILAQ